MINSSLVKKLATANASLKDVKETNEKNNTAAATAATATLDLDQQKHLFEFLQVMLNAEVAEGECYFGNEMFDSSMYDLEKKFKKGKRMADDGTRFYNRVQSTRGELSAKHDAMSSAIFNQNCTSYSRWNARFELKATLENLEALRESIIKFAYEVCPHITLSDDAWRTLKKIFSENTKRYQEKKKEMEAISIARKSKAAFLMGCYKPSGANSTLKTKFVDAPMFDRNTIGCIFELLDNTKIEAPNSQSQTASGSAAASTAAVNK